MKKRRAVQNHLGGVHALAMGNLCELAAGLVTEVTLPDDMRWIPRGMNIQYVGQARSNVTAEAFIEQRIYTEKENITVEVKVKDDQEKTIVTADITMYLSPRS
jgi:acyl-coenzyme A thioesterase PaaI-like protein